MKQDWSHHIQPEFAGLVATQKMQPGDGVVEQPIGTDPALLVLSDESLMERISQGDEAAYGALVDRHLGQSTGLARRILAHPDDAEEVMQEAFIRLWRHAPNWQPGKARFSTWFYRVIVNLCIDHKRKAKRRPQANVAISPDQELQESRIDPGFAASQASHGQADPGQALDQRQTHQAVRDALDQLPDRQKLAITLCYFQELSNKEAADIMDVNIKALESLLSRGRKNLAQHISHLNGGMEQ